MSTLAGQLARQLALVALIAPGAALAQGTSSPESSAVRAIIAATYDRPDAKVETDPVVVSGSYAVADWIQGEKGGRAVLRKIDGSWTILLCGGDALKTDRGLRGAGVPGGTARQLAEALAVAERNLPHERLHRFGLFQAESNAPNTHHHH